MRIRIDLVLRKIEFDVEKGFIKGELTPDPRRYEWKVINGEEFLYDKLDNLCYPREVLDKALKDIIELPIYYQRPEVDNVEQYVKSRLLLIDERMKGRAEPFAFQDKSEEFLESLAENKLGFVIMCIDMIRSTNLSLSLELEKYAKMIEVLLFEMSEIVSRYHGHVLKYTGDGLIAYFPEPSFISKNDLALDCALAVRRLLYNALNPVLKKYGCPNIHIRIGLESGDAYVVSIGSPSTKRHKDIIGAVVNLACKIQSLGNAGDVLLGETTYRNLHITRKLNCEEHTLPDNWIYLNENREPYKVYRVKFIDSII
jgi:adenylate cyclase